MMQTHLDDQTVHLLYGVAYVFIAMFAVMFHGCNIGWLWRHAGQWMPLASRLVHWSLTVASLGLMFGVPWTVVSCFTGGGRWSFSESLCQWRAAEAMCTGLAFLMTLYLCCVDRFLVIHYHSWYNKHGCRVMVPVLAVVWLAAAVLGFIPMLGYGHYGPEPQGTSCLVDLTRHDRSTAVYILGLAAFTFVLPVLIGLFSLVSAHLGLKRQNKACTKLRQMNKLVAALFSLATLGWTPFVYIYVAKVFQPQLHFSLPVLYLGPICCKLVVSMLPVLYWRMLATSENPSKPKIVYTKSGRAKKVE